MQAQSSCTNKEEMRFSEHERGTGSSKQNGLLHRNQQARPDLPSFPQWQAEQLSSRDIWFAAFLLCMYLAYLRKTLPAVCSNMYMNSQQQENGGHNRQQQWPALWQIICGESDAAILHSSRIVALAKTLCRAIVTFCSIGLLSGDPLHIIIPPLRISLLLLVLVPLPYISITAIWHTMAQRIITRVGSRSVGPISSSRRSGNIIQWYHPDSYWRKPAIRNIVIVIQRITPSAIAATCLGFNACGIGWYTLVQQTSLWRLIGKYSCQGWIAWLAVLPLHLHLMFNILEWGINYIFYANTLDASGKPLGYLDADRLCTSFLCIVVLPTLGVLWLESSQKKRYQQLLLQHQAVAQSLQRQRQQQLARSGLGNARTAADGDRSTGLQGEQAALDGKGGSSSSGVRSQQQQQQQQQQQPGAGSSISKETLQKGSSDSSSLHNSKTRSSLDRLPAGHNDQDLTVTPNSCSSNDIAADLLPSLISLLGHQAAGAVAAAAATVTGASALGMLSKYESITQSMPINIKVHTSHDISSVTRLGPVLQSVLHYQLMSAYPADSSPLAIHTAVFQGCVQFIANVIGLRRQLASIQQQRAGTPAAAADHNSGSSGSGGDLDSAGAKKFAAGLLDKVVEAIRLLPAPAAAAAAPDGSSSQPGVDVAVAGSNASTRVSNSSSSNSSSSARIPLVALQSIDPICVIADQAGDQEIRLSLTLSGQQQQQQPQQPHGDQEFEDQEPGNARLLVFRDGAVTTDIDTVLNQLISFTVPPQTPGVLQLVLLQGRKPAPPAEAAAAEAMGSEDLQQAIRVDDQIQITPGPLILLPLLVLPQAAAQEMEHYHQQLRLADHDCSSSSSSDVTARALDSVSAVVTDAAYLLSICEAAKAAAVEHGSSSSSKAAAAKQPMPAGAQAVLKHLLIHLAACGMFEVMRYVVDAAAAVFTADNSSSSSSTGAAAVVPADLTAAAADGSSSTPAPTAAAAGNSSSKSCKNTTKAAAAAAVTSKPPSTTGLDQGLVSDTTSPDVVTASELLWGFSDPSLEARYQAAAFTNSGWLDVFLLIYVTTMSIGCLVRQARNHGGWAPGAAAQMGNAAGQQCNTAAAAAATWGSAMFSDILFSLAYLSGPLPVLLLRLRIARQLQQQQQQDSVPILLRAAKIKEALLLFWMLTVPVITAVFATTDVLVTPGWVVKAWGQRGLSQDLGSVFAVGLKGFTAQVPFSCFWPIMLVQTIVAGIGGIKYGIVPPYWVLVRYVPALALTLVVNARQHIAGRGRFCRRSGVQVQP